MRKLATQKEMRRDAVKQANRGAYIGYRILADNVYNPIKTKMLKAAGRKAALRCINTR